MKKPIVALDQQLRDRIASQEIPPGAKLRESEVAERFGVSRAAVRDAFGILAQRGLIERIPNRGAVVKRLGHEQIVEIFAVREVLEGLGARQAAQKAPREFWGRHVAALGEPMEGYVRDGDFESFLSSYDAFRRDIIVAADNQLLTDMLDGMREKIMVLARRIIILPGRAAQALQEHRAVLDALCRGDAEAAEVLRKENMRSGLRWLERYRNFIL